MSYDVFDIPKGYRTSVILLIAPYFDPTFVNTVVNKLSPEKVRILIDDGIRATEIERLLDAANGTADVKVVLSAAAGLVHIKGYYVEFVKADGKNRRKRRFFMDLRTPLTPHSTAVEMLSFLQVLIYP